MISRVIFVLVIWMSLSSLGGCAAFRWGDTQSPVSWPLSEGPGKQSISLILTAESFYFGTRQDIPLETIEVWQEATAKAYKESGLFSDVKTGAAETDLRVEVHVLRRVKGESPPQLLLLLIPTIEWNEFVIRTTLKNKEGQELGAFEKKDGYTEVSGPIVIFIMPLKEWPDTISFNMLYDLNRATLSQAYDAGLLKARH